MSQLLPHLKELVESHTALLPAVGYRRMFGCDAYFVRGNIFSLIWKTGRIGLRLPDQAAFDEAMAMEGAEPWAPGEVTKGMAHWVLVSEALHDDEEGLSAWVEKAYAMNAKLAPKNAKSAKPKTAKPKTAKPKTAKPKTAKPKTAKPKTAKPKRM